MDLRIARFVHMFLNGILAGIGVGIAATETANLKLDGSSYPRVEQHKHTIVIPLTLTLFFPCVFVGSYVAWRTRRQNKDVTALTVSSVVCITITFLLSIIINAPINRAQRDEWDVNNPPKDWKQIRDKWNISHVVRSIFALVSLACNVLAWQKAGSIRTR
ncbi:MAG: DUF1772 domain-containing protein [Chloroflexota bacterium]|nr:DUF1772 domain-containing protein [Chloroflexota bacterium]